MTAADDRDAARRKRVRRSVVGGGAAGAAGAQPPEPFKVDDYTSYSPTTTTRRLQLWEFDYVPQWSHPWRDLSLTLDGHVVVITGPQGPVGRFVLGRNDGATELILAANRLRARAPGHSPVPGSHED
ncbi:hypothetical protein ACN6AT_34465 [Streptomyces sp. JL4002]|uniref:hypothetical protein n=1 Tax=Streptomyces sp. JL4002 TaxID=3404781 RepID=UPI003B28454B